ncbi:MAG: hypothetical protein RLZZ587_56 [Actinomycetota bacterium]|jgi:hypothetical protein
MEIRIGIQHAPRELAFETETSAADINAQLTAALAQGGVLSLSDIKGQSYLIPAGNVAYIEFGSTQSRPVGFVN